MDTPRRCGVWQRRQYAEPLQKQKGDIAKSMWVGATVSYHQEQLWASQWGYKQRALGFLGGPEGIRDCLKSFMAGLGHQVHLRLMTPRLDGPGSIPTPG